MDWLSVRYPLTITEVESLEQEFDIKLPQDYKNIIGPINGGALRNAYIEVMNLGKVAFSRNVSLQKDVKSGVRDLLPALNDKVIQLFPFASVGNGDYFCFDLTENIVVLYQHEKQTTVYVCNTFSQFLKKLTIC